MGITSVKIPSSVSTIGQRAFYNNKINGYIYKIVLNKMQVSVHVLSVGIVYIVLDLHLMVKQ